MGENSHEHITVEEMNRANKIGGNISEEDVDWLIQLEDKVSDCPVCEKRVRAFDTITCMFGNNFFDTSY